MLRTEAEVGAHMEKTVHIKKIKPRKKTTKVVVAEGCPLLGANKP